jgi:hypothetical protein
MKKFEFNHTHKSWDRYKAFYYSQGPLTEFETGEVMVTYHPRPDQRRTYEKYGIQLVTTTDRDCPTLYFDEKLQKPVPMAWFNQSGMQQLAVDLERGIAVKLSSRRYRSTKDPSLQFLGDHTRGAVALWTGPERMPVPLSTISVSEPDKDVRKELRTLLADTRKAVVAAARMRDLPKIWGEDKWPANPDWVDWTVEQLCAYVCADEYRMRTVYTNGFSYPRKQTQHDFLYVEKKG